MIRDVVDLSQLTAPDLVLDVAGGGEGMIGRALGRQVVSIDISRPELEEASNEALKLVMDAADMSFLDSSFTDATCFFGLMYMPAQLRPRVLAEIFRVLAPGGCLRIWDAEIPPVAVGGSAENDVFMIELEAIVGSGERAHPHRTTYGVGLRDKAQSCCSITRAAVDCGFVVLGHAGSGRTFHLGLLKPYGSDGQLAGKTPTGIGPMRIVRAAARDLQDAYEVLADSCRRVVNRGRPIPHWLFASEGVQHVADKIRDCDYFIGYIDDSPAGALWIKWADAGCWGDAGSDRTAGYVHGLGVRQEWAGAGIGVALLEWASSYIASRGRSMVKLECDAGSPGLRAPFEIRFEGASMGGHRLVDVARLVQSHQRADSSTLKFFSLLLAALFAFVILNDNALHIRHVSMKAVELIVACVFAFSVLLRSFLVYYYDRVE